MDGILEQILVELWEIKQILNNKENGLKSQVSNNTMKTKEAADYLGITEYRIRALTKKGEIKHFKAGNRILYKRSALDQWLEEVQEASIMDK